MGGEGDAEGDCGEHLRLAEYSVPAEAVARKVVGREVVEGDGDSKVRERARDGMRKARGGMEEKGCRLSTVRQSEE